MSDITVNGGTDVVEIEDDYVYNRAGERIESIPVMAKELGIKAVATLSNQVEKSIEAGEMRAQRKQGRTLYFRVTDIKAAHAKYGRKPSEGMVAKAEFDALALRNNELSAENAALLLRVRELEELLAGDLSNIATDVVEVDGALFEVA